MKSKEKIFTGNDNIAALMNVGNAGEIFIEHKAYVEKRIKEKKENDRNKIE